MKRIAALIAALLLTAAASADTVELNQTVGFACLHQYHSISNDAGLQLDITGSPYYWIPGYPLYLYVGGDYANPYVGAYTVGHPTMIMTQASTGTQYTVTLHETSVTTHGYRGFQCTHWTLLSGSIVR